jgi:hypothetical protein
MYSYLDFIMHFILTHVIEPNYIHVYPKSMTKLYSTSLLTELQVPLKCMNSLCTSSLYSHFSSIWRMQTNLISSRSVMWKPTLMIPSNLIYIWS